MLCPVLCLSPHHALHASLAPSIQRMGAVAACIGPAVPYSPYNALHAPTSRPYVPRGNIGGLWYMNPVD